MKTRYALVAALTAAALLTVLWAQASPPSFEKEVARAVLTIEVQNPGSRCPLNSTELARAEPWMIAACLAGGLGWYEAVQRYGEDAASVMAVYGQEPSFAEVLDRYGHAVIPVIVYFVENGSTQYQLEDSLSRLLTAGDLSIRRLSPEQYGLIAINELGRRGHEMLSEFEIVAGKAKRKQFTRALLGAKNLLFGGVSELDSVMARAERLPKWSEVGWAGLDLAIIGGAAGAAIKIFRAGRVPATITAQTAGRLSLTRSAFSNTARSLSVIGRAAGVGAIVAVPYVLLIRPDLIVAAGGWLADAAGLPAWFGAFLVYAALCLAVLVIARLVLSPLINLARLLGAALAWLAGLNHIQATARRTAGSSSI